MAQEAIRTHVVLPKELVRSIDEVAGRRRRSQFVAEAVAEKLARTRRAIVLKEAAGALAGRDVPGWESTEAAIEWVRRSRAADDVRLERLRRP
jgi:predicted transcriptional regulator